MRSRIFLRGSRLSALALGCLLAISVGASALADVVVPLSQTADTTWHTNGMVRAIAQVGNRIYLGGRFSELRELSIQKTGGATISVANLGAFDAATGAGVTGFSPAVTSLTNPTVYAMAVSNDRLFVGGKFSEIDGVKARNLAAIDVDPSSPGYGSVISSFKPKPTGTVWALAADGNSLYAGGKFNTVGGVSHPNVARFSVTGDGTATLDNSWNVSTAGETTEGGRVRDIQFDPDRPGSVFLVGHFYTVTDPGGTYALRTVARIGSGGMVDASFAPPQSFGINNFGISAYVDGGSNRLFLGTGANDWVGAFSTGNGAKLWKTDTNGQAQAVTMVGPALIVGGHFTVAGIVTNYSGCAAVPFDPTKCANRTRIAAFDPSTGVLDLEWVPTVTGSYNGVWRAVPSGGALWIGGEFKKVTGVQHSYVARLGPA